MRQGPLPHREHVKPDFEQFPWSRMFRPSKINAGFSIKAEYLFIIQFSIFVPFGAHGNGMGTPYRGVWVLLRIRFFAHILARSVFAFASALGSLMTTWACSSSSFRRDIYRRRFARIACIGFEGEAEQ